MHIIQSNKKFYVICLSIYLLCLPLNAMALGTLGSVVKFIALLPIGAALLNLNKFRANNFIIGYFLFTLLSLFSIVWTISYDKTLDRTQTYIQLFILMASSCCFRYDTNDLACLKKVLVWSSRISVVIILIFGTYSEGRLLLSGLITEDPNYFCAYLLFGVVNSLQILLSKGKLIKKITASIEIGVYFLVVLLTGSRGGLLALGTSLIAMLILWERPSFRVIFKKIIIIGLFVILFISLSKHLAPEIARRFTIDNVIESGGSHRMDIWMQGIDAFRKASIFNQLFGYGSSSIRTVFINGNYQIINVMHNVFLETLVELGVIGFLLYFFYLTSLVKTTFIQSDSFAFSILIGMIVMSLSTSLYAFKPYINIMIYANISCFYLSKKNINTGVQYCKPMGAYGDRKYKHLRA